MRRDSAKTGRKPPSPLILQRHVIPSKAGTYWERPAPPAKAVTY